MAKSASRTVDVIIDIPVPRGMMMYTIKDEENDRYEVKVVPTDWELIRELQQKDIHPTINNYTDKNDRLTVKKSLKITVSVTSEAL